MIRWFIPADAIGADIGEELKLTRNDAMSSVPFALVSITTTLLLMLVAPAGTDPKSSNPARTSAVGKVPVITPVKEAASVPLFVTLACATTRTLPLLWGCEKSTLKPLKVIEAGPFGGVTACATALPEMVNRTISPSIETTSEWRALVIINSPN
jgi:hypothetical protein